MNKDLIIVLSCVSLIVLSFVISVSFYFSHKNSLMSNNIESAIQKGIDPLSVRCSYAESKDLICAVHASSIQNSQNANIISTTKK